VSTGLAYLRWGEDRLLPAHARNALTGPGAPFEMRDEKVLGTEMNVFARRPRSARQTLESAAERFGDQPFLIFPDRTYTYRGIQEPVRRMASALSDRFGIAPGDRVGIVAANIPGHAVVAWAVVALGGVVVELNGWWTAPELLHGIGLSRPKVLFGDRRRLDRLRDSALGIPVVCLDDEFDSLVAGSDDRSLPADRVAEDDPLCVLFTSRPPSRARSAQSWNPLLVVQAPVVQGRTRRRPGRSARSGCRRCSTSPVSRWR
jgi:hypothetical protein